MANNVRTSPLRFGAYHMIGQDAWEPQRTNNFELQFMDIGNLVSIDKGLHMPGNSSELLTLSTKDVGSLTTNISALQVNYGNNQINFAGKPSYSNVAITYNDFIGIQTERIIMAWSRLVYDPKTEKVGRASQYKKNGYLLEFSPDGDFVKMWQLEGAFPADVSFDSYSNENNSIRSINVTFYVDKVMPLDDGLENWVNPTLNF
jgi:hypothetical protein